MLNISLYAGNIFTSKVTQKDGFNSTDEMIQHCNVHLVKYHSVNIVWIIKM